MISRSGRGPGGGGRLLCPHRRDDHGTVTAETAVVLPTLLMVVAACVWVISVAVAQLHCVDAAHGAARAAARGEAADQVRAAAADAAPQGARIDVAARGGGVTVSVHAVIRPFGGLLRLVPAAHVGATASAVVENGS